MARLRRHVENDSPNAILTLGSLYRSSDGGQLGIVKNEKKAVKIFKRAAELGSLHAMICLASMFKTGSGVKPNRTKAMQLMRAASDRGYAEAQWDLARLLRDDERHEEAFQFFKLSAEQNFTEALICLGRCYMQGQGVDSDLDEAKRCFARAAANGDKDAQEVLDQIEHERELEATLEILRQPHSSNPHP